MATITKKTQWKRRRPDHRQLSRADIPYTMKLSDGRTIYIEVPGRWTAVDRSGQIGFLPPGIRFLDRIRSLASCLTTSLTPGFITTLREALNFTQAELGKKLDVDKMTISRWERGTMRPSENSLRLLEQVRREAVKKGVVLPT